MSETTWRRGRKHSYTDRPLTDSERVFAEENHNILYKYMNINHLDISEFYDVLVIPYLNAVKKYFENEECRQYSFSTVAFLKLDTAVKNYYRAIYTQKRMPEGGLVSLELSLVGDNPFSEFTPNEWYIDCRMSTEKSAIALHIMEQIFQSLDERQEKLLRMKADGFTVREMTEEFDTTTYSIHRELKEIDKIINSFR